MAPRQGSPGGACPLSRLNRLWLARHAQTVWNVEARLQGHLDSPLTQLGVRQAEALARALAKRDLKEIHCSPARRVLATVRPVLEVHPRVPLIEDQDLREIHLGPWEGLTKDEIRRRWPKELEAFWYRPAEFRPVGGGEDYYQLLERVKRWWGQVASRWEGGERLVVSHGVTLQVLLLHLEGADLPDLHRDRVLQQCSLTLVEWDDPAQPRVVFRNGTDHLTGLTE